MIILENQLLNDKMFAMPKKLTDHLKLVLSNNLDKKDSKGYKRLNSLINSDYNKRNKLKGEKRYISYSDLKRINHDFDNMPNSKDNIEYMLNGGNLMNQWVKQTLRTSREGVEDELKKMKTDTLRRNKVKPKKNPTKIASIRSELNSLTEETDMNHPYYDKMNDYDVYYVLSAIKYNDNFWTPLINPMMYEKALSEFVKFGYISNFPEKYIYQWIGIIMKNTATLRACTEIAGHDMYYPIEALIDVFFEGDTDKFEEYKSENGIDDDTDAYDMFCDENGIYDKLKLPDGSDGWSDYGIDPLEELIAQYNRNMKPEEVLVLINKILDVTHQRGDLSSIFIEGGAKSLTKISYNENRQVKKIYIKESQINELRQQLTLPFDGNPTKMIYEHFIDWLESIGHYGTLPSSKYDFNDLIDYTVQNKTDEIINMCFDNIDLMNEAIPYLLENVPVEDIENMLNINDEFERNYTAENIKNNYDSTTLIANINDYGIQRLKEIFPEYIEDIINENELNVKTNDRNLVEIERVIEIPKLTSKQGDFYKELQNKFKGIGNYWSFENGDAYCSQYNGDTIGIIALVDPSQIDMIRTIYCSIYDLHYEKEIYIPKGEVEIVAITTDDGKKLPLKNHIIVKV